ncbi:MAG: histidine phosphatase family protein, partial [Gammaproteobacteria bacterium]|nr:histidine phosphatase family protein [Gammaproteobacteria bacterium]
MKRILLLRHAKSDWKDYTLADFDRPLAPRGRAAAPRVAACIRDHDLVPDRVL